MNPFSVLIVEDDLVFSKVIRKFLKDKEYEIAGIIDSGEEAIEFTKNNSVDLIIMDIVLNGKINGIQAAKEINKHKNIPILYLTSHTDKEIVESARKTKPIGYIIKPFSSLQMEITLEMARNKIIVDQELKNYQNYLEQLVVDRTRELLSEVKMHKDVQEKAIESEIKLKAITRAANDAIVLFDELGQISFWNKAAEKLFLFDEKEMLNHNIRVLFSSDNQNMSASKGLEIIQNVIDNKLVNENIEITATRADGVEIPVEMSLAKTSIQGENSIISIVRDISQHKRDNEEIGRFKLIADLANYGLAITTANGKFVYINKYFAHMLDSKQSDLIGESFYSITPHIKRSKITNFVTEASQIQGGEGREVSIVSRKNKEIPVMMNSIIVHDKYNQVKFYAVSAIDMRERKEYEENLLKAKKIAEESDRMKTAFLSTISHELRTPLNAIIGFSELIKLTEPNGDIEEVKDFNEEIYKSGNHLLSVVEDILDVSMLESNDLKIIPSDFSLNNLMRKLYDKFQSNERYDNHLVSLDWEGNLPDNNDQIYSDNSKIEQIFSKLLDNAFKFSEQGKILFGYKFNKQLKRHLFYVKDEGLGIEKEKLGDIFESFEQVDQGDIIAHHGLGLGLAIVSQLIELMGGHITVKSEIGKGSTFEFYFNQLQKIKN
ncbi:MAG: hypothetical protein B7C24_00780 [Bacteroidetes bacterium 4572_77]|nr:MAG: hypothetical protein B7C24_00780 [Bacteroidetes bacterium 4572_77]